MLYGTILPYDRRVYPEDCIMCPDATAQVLFTAEDCKDENVMRMIREIDDNTVHVTPDGYVFFTSPVLGSISISQFSTGVKTMMLAYLGANGDKVRSDHMGNNCLVLLAELAKDRDIEIYLCHEPMEDFPIYVTNVGKVIDNWLELMFTIREVRDAFSKR